MIAVAREAGAGDSVRLESPGCLVARLRSHPKYLIWVMPAKGDSTYNPNSEFVMVGGAGLCCVASDAEPPSDARTRLAAGGGMTHGFADFRVFIGTCLPPPSAGLAGDLIEACVSLDTALSEASRSCRSSKEAKR
jgi:hypothetical protein